jgi:NADPH:quinone reductase-like Zn-dependent oxidoreductase
MANLPDQMTAAVTVGHGGPDMIELRSDWPRPQPGPGQVLVQVSAAAVNNTDLWTRRGAYGSSDDPDAVAGWRGVPLDFPRIQGGDISGVVAEVGEGVDNAMVGRRVIVDPATRYDDGGHPSSIVGSEVDGGFAQFHLSPAGRVHDVDDSPLSDTQLACLPIAYATALGMIEAAGCSAGERVLVTGASGGVGLAAIQILAGRGCMAIAYTSEGKESAVKRAGASRVLTRGNSLAEVPEVDAVLDVVGGSGLGELVGRLRTGGRLAMAGAIAGPVVELDLRRIYLRHRQLIGSTMHDQQTFAGVVELARRGTVAPLVADTYPLDQIEAAQARFEKKDFVGKLVLVIPAL